MAMYPGTYCHRDMHHLDPPPNGAQVLSIALRLLALAFALASAVEMLTSADCATTGAGVVVATTTGYSRYSAFSFLAGSNITVTILQAVAIILQALLLAKPAPDPDLEVCTVVEPEPESQLPEVLSVAMDVLTLALVFSATASAYTTAYDYAAQIGACPRFADQVATAKALSLAAASAAAFAVLLKRVILPFNVLPPV